MSADGSAYGVPVNYYYSDAEAALFFHCAVKGKKLDYIKTNPNVSFAAVTASQIAPGRFTTLYESVIVSGRASVISEKAEVTKRLEGLCAALDPYGGKADETINKYIDSTLIVRIDIDEISGKRGA